MVLHNRSRTTRLALMAATATQLTPCCGGHQPAYKPGARCRQCRRTCNSCLAPAVVGAVRGNRFCTACAVANFGVGKLPRVLY